MDLFHIDIETVGNYSDFQSFELNDKRGSNLFRNVYESRKWNEKYESIEEAYIENSSLISTYGRIVCISFGFLDNNNKKNIRSFFGNDEKDIVNSFNELLKRIQTKRFNLCGYRIENFDIPWILHKLHKYDIEPANIIYLYDKKPWENRIIDMSYNWKYKNTWSFSFDEVCYELDIKSSKDDITGSDVHTKYWSNDIESIKKYCEKDISASIDCASKIYKN